MDLTKASALVTGGGSGIGKAIAAILVARGARVAISGRRQSVLGAAARELSVPGRDVVPIVADVSREEDVVRMIDTARASLPVRYADQQRGYLVTSLRWLKRVRRISAVCGKPMCSVRCSPHAKVPGTLLHRITATL